jgi:YHS domain-containing protein
MRHAFTSIALVVLLAGLTVSGRAGSFQQPAQAPSLAREALLGFDPILVIAGKDQLGRDDVTSEFEGFKYLFATAENKKTFDADPSRYAIQLGGSCARMGGNVSASPDLYTVFSGRIYAFGSSDCLKAFQTEPAAYLETPEPVSRPSATAASRAAVLVKRAATKAGGDAVLAKLTGWEESWSRPMGQGTASIVAHGGLGETLTQTTDAPWGLLMETIDGVRADRSMGGRVQPMHPGGRAALLQDMHRHPMALLAAANRPGATLVPLGPGSFAGASVEFVRVSWQGVVSDLALAADGTLAGVRFKGRVTSGRYGVIERVIRARQDVSGLSWPVEYELFHDGKPSGQPPTKISAVQLTLAAR